jgi:hypothetical protein
MNASTTHPRKPMTAIDRMTGNVILVRTCFTQNIVVLPCRHSIEGRCLGQIFYEIIVVDFSFDSTLRATRRAFVRVDRRHERRGTKGHQVIRKHALGTFSELLVASAHSPAMLAYLDQNQSRAGRPNQNYVRELMELHTLGVDGGYTQQDVDELARVFTGWSINNQGEFVFLPNRHDYTAKTVLGVTIAATSPATGMAGQQEGEQMLAFLVNHASTSRFIARKLLQWFITPEPTTTQIEAIAGVFRATKGDLKLTVRAVLNEGWVSAAPAKLKRPFHLVVSALRSAAPLVNSVAPMNTQVRVAGQPLFQYETPDGYPDLTEYWSGNLTPRWNFGTTLATLTNNTTINVDAAPYLAGTPEAAIEMLATNFFGDELASSTRAALLDYLRAGTFNATRVRETMALAIASAEFQWY